MLKTGGIDQFEQIARSPSWIWEGPRYGVTINRAVGEFSRGPDSVHIQVPGHLAPGSVSVRNRTWIEQSASE
jgi:hypothetical protein